MLSASAFMDCGEGEEGEEEKKKDKKKDKKKKKPPFPEQSQKPRTLLQYAPLRLTQPKQPKPPPPSAIRQLERPSLHHEPTAT